jgi:hypothetical protein
MRPSFTPQPYRAVCLPYCVCLRAFERKQRRKNADDFRKLADGFPVPEATDDDGDNDGPLLQPEDSQSREEALATASG